jgi:hypothetical protein
MARVGSGEQFRHDDVCFGASPPSSSRVPFGAPILSSLSAASFGCRFLSSSLVFLNHFVDQHCRHHYWQHVLDMQLP